MTPKQIIAENKRRNAVLDEEYKPLRGEGSPIPRFRVQFVEGTTWWLPETMREIPAVVETQRAIKKQGRPFTWKEWWPGPKSKRKKRGQFFDEKRFEHDFEYWCARVAKIKNKQGEVVSFYLNRPQRQLLARVEEQRRAGLPVRQIILKHRQWGCTTFSYTYLAWHQMVLYTGRDAWFVGLDQDGARDVVERYDMIRENAGLTLKNYGGSAKTRRVVERDCYVAVGSVERPNAPSGRPAQLIHLFEMGKWPSNANVSAERVAQNMGAMLPDDPGTVSIIESSAQGGTGTYFKQICDQAQKGESLEGAQPYQFLFVSWIDDPQYRRECVPKEVASSLTSYESELWEEGATLEGIEWRRWQASKPEYIDDWRLKEEFPATPEEAFQTGERRVFHPLYVKAAKKTCKQPILRGRLISDAEEGQGAFAGLGFERDPRGPLVVWRLPGDTYNGLLEGRTVVHRYAAAGDTGGSWSGADYNVGAMLDRAPRLFGGHPEIVAEWHGHMDQDLFAWELARLGYWYEKAHLIVEANKFDSNPSENPLDPDETFTTLDVLRAYYPNLYMRQVNPDNIYDKRTDRVGFNTNVKTKSEIVSALRGMLRRSAGEQGLLEGMAVAAVADEETSQYVERCLPACAEMDTYLYIQKSARTTMGAAPKMKDDRVITRCLLAFVDSVMPAPAYVVVQPRRAPMTTAMISA